MPEAVRVGDLTDHSMPIQGSGSPDVFIGGQKAWRGLPEGVGEGLDTASEAVCRWPPRSEGIWPR
jgi:hypothetical protein